MLDVQDIKQENRSSKSQQMVTTDDICHAQHSLYERKTTQAVSHFEFFRWRIFVARLHGRVNIEDLATGERFSVQLHDMTVQSDWCYEQENDSYHLKHVPLVIDIVGNMVFINHLEHGMSLTIRV